MSSTPCAARTAPRHSLQITAQSLVSPVPRLDARRCARSIPDSYAGRLVVATGGASGERGFVVLTLLPHRASTRSIPHVPAYKEGLPVVNRRKGSSGADASAPSGVSATFAVAPHTYVGQMMLPSNRLRRARPEGGGDGAGFQPAARARAASLLCVRAASSSGRAGSCFTRAAKRSGSSAGLK